MKTLTPEALEHTTGDEHECPARACHFVEEAPVTFAEPVEAGGKTDGIRILANSGKPILGHWWWGNFAIDLKGLSIGRKNKPILLDHRSDKIVGFTSKISKTDEGIVAEGTILTGDSETFDAGRRVKELADRGYPWQASVYVPPTEVEFVPKDTYVEVNGYKLEGPGHIFRKSVLREVTVTSLGADESTDAELFGAGRKELIVAKLTKNEPQDADSSSGDPNPSKLEDAGGSTAQVEASVTNTSNEVTITQFSHHPQKPVVKADEFSAAQRAVADERERVARLSKAAEPHQKALLSDLIADGTSVADGLEQLFADHKKFAAEKLGTLANDAPEGVEFSDDSGESTGNTDRDREISKFKKSKDLQDEFMGDQDLYLAFCEAEGILEGSE